jgi:hypothetical protein
MNGVGEMLNRIDYSSLDELLEADLDTCVSIFLPTESVPPESDRDRIRLKNQLSDAETMLNERGMQQIRARSLLGPIRECLDDEAFWRDSNRGVAIFLADSFERIYTTSHAFQPFVHIGDRFHITSLLPALQAQGSFLLLAISLEGVRLYQGDSHELEEWTPETIPDGLRETLRYDDPERRLQFHTSTTSTHADERSAAFHGHSVGAKEAKKERIQRYFQKVSDAIDRYLREEGPPIVLAGVEYLHPIYREASDHPKLLEKAITGNPEEYKKEELHAEAWELVEPHYREDVQQIREMVLDNLQRERASTDLREILPAAFQTRVAALLVQKDHNVWGRYDPEGDEVAFFEEPELGSEDLLNLAALYTLQYGGRALTLSPDEMPGGESAAAILRF